MRKEHRKEAIENVNEKEIGKIKGGKADGRDGRLNSRVPIQPSADYIPVDPIK